MEKRKFFNKRNVNTKNKRTNKVEKLRIYSPRWLFVHLLNGQWGK
jgi:hypothetical protein